MNNARHVDNLERMVAFCENNSDCRCAVLLNYFGECGKICHDFQTMCDICKTKMVKATESDFQSFSFNVYLDGFSKLSRIESIS